MAPVKVIVPDKMQMAYWKQILSRKSWSAGRGGGFIGTEVISFSKLAMAVLNAAEQTPQLIPARLDSLCIKEAISNALKKQPFQYFGPISRKPGLLSVFEKTIKLLQHGCITPEKLGETAENDSKAADTARVYREYLDLLKKNNWIGSVGLSLQRRIFSKKNCQLFPSALFLLWMGSTS